MSYIVLVDGKRISHFIMVKILRWLDRIVVEENLGLRHYGASGELA
jgi:hypothetical protein